MGKTSGGRVTIRDVAGLAGVGVGTVSRVLNGSSAVSPERRAAVLAAIATLGYRPSEVARQLSRRVPRQVAVLVTFMTRPSVVERLRGIVHELIQDGFDPIVFDVETASQRDHHLEAITERYLADGLLAVSVPVPEPLLERLRQVRCPVVFVDWFEAGVPAVGVDDVAGGALATEHLLGLGHERIAFLGDVEIPGLGFRSTPDRERGFRAALFAAGVGVREEWIVKVPHGAQPAADAARAFLASPERPTAVVAASDTQAIGVLRAASELGLRVPGDLSVIGYDDIEMAAAVGLTTIHQPLIETGVRGARLLKRLFRGGPPPADADHEILPVAIVERRTTGPPRAPGRDPERRGVRATALSARDPPARRCLVPEQTDLGFLCQ